MPHDNFEYLVSDFRISKRDEPRIGRPLNAQPLQQVKTWLAQANLDPGARLPPERSLAQQLGISRTELRKAMAILENEGTVERSVGRGTFLAQPSAAVQTPAALLDLTARTGPHDAMMARIALEPELSHLAALHATPRQVGRAQALAAEIRGAKTWQTYETLDHRLHDLIAEAAGNPLLYELHRIVNAVRKVVVWRQLAPGIEGPPPDYHSFDEHDAIVAAIAERDQAAARKSMRIHLRATLAAMTSDD